MNLHHAEHGCKENARPKAPAFQFYAQDFLADERLAVCSLAAVGLWIKLLCFAWQSDRPGHVEVNGRPPTSQQLCRMVGCSALELRRLQAELLAAGVPSITDDGVWYSRRMVRDAHIRQVRAEAGKRGGNPTLLKQMVNQKDNHTAKQTGKQKPTPSSSSSVQEYPTGIPAGSSRRRDEHADAFAAGYQKHFGQAYAWQDGDFPQLAKWRAKFPDVTPEQFAAVALWHWQQGQFGSGNAATIRGLASNWQTLQAKPAAEAKRAKTGGNGRLHPAKAATGADYSSAEVRHE